MLEDLANIDLVFKVILGAGAVVALLAGLYRWVWPRLAEFGRGLKVLWITFVGADPIREPVTGRELKPATPSLGLRLAKMEDSQGKVATALERLANFGGEMEEVKAQLVAIRRDQALELEELRREKADAHVTLERRIIALEQGTVERIVTRAESAAMWTAITDEKQPPAKPKPAKPLDPPPDAD